MIRFREVTWFSTAVAVALFGAVFFIGFILGMGYADVYNGKENAQSFENEITNPEALLESSQVTIPGTDLSVKLENGTAEFVAPETGEPGVVSIDPLRTVWENGTRTDVTSIMHITIGDAEPRSYLTVFSIDTGKMVQRSAQLLGSNVAPTDLKTGTIKDPLPNEDYIITLQWSEETQSRIGFFLVSNGNLQRIN